jgi:hypothetical protein
MSKTRKRVIQIMKRAQTKKNIKLNLKLPKKVKLKVKIVLAK